MLGIIITRLIVLFVFIALLVNAWKMTGGKENALIERLIVLLFGALSMLGFFAPDTPVGGAIFSVSSFAFTPLGLGILLLVGSMTLITNGGIKNPAPTLIFVAVLILIISSTPFVAFWLAQQAEKDAYQAIKLSACCRETAPAIVILGWGTTQPQLPDRNAIQVTDISNRIPYSATLYRNQLAPFIIVSAGPRPELEGHFIEGDDIKKILVNSLNVPPDNIIVENQSLDIHTSAEEVKKLLKYRRLPLKVILVTSALEIRRAASTFNGVGIKVLPKATDFYSFQTDDKIKRRIRGYDFFPSAEALLITTKVIEEYLAYFYYLLRGWLAPTI